MYWLRYVNPGKSLLRNCRAEAAVAPEVFCDSVWAGQWTPGHCGYTSGALPGVDQDDLVVRPGHLVGTGILGQDNIGAWMLAIAPQDPHA